MYKENTKTDVFGYQFSNTDSPNFDFSGKSTVTYTSFTDGVSFPGYRRQIRKRGDATTPFQGVKKEIKASGNPEAFANFYREDIGYAWSHRMAGYYHPPRFNSVRLTGANEALNAALGSYYSSIASAMSEFKGIVAAGELKETIALIRNPAKSILGVMNAYLGSAKKLTKYKRTQDRVDSLRDLYLEYQFAWKPLFADIKDAVKAAKKIKDQCPSIRVHGFGKQDTGSTTNSFEKEYGITSLNMLVTEKESFRTEVSLSGSIALSMSDFKPSAQFGFTPKEFLPSLWELLPYSFLVDYFSNVGDVLNAISYASVAATYNCQSTRYVASLEVTGKMIRPVGFTYLQNYEGSYSWSTNNVTVNRSRFVPSVPSLALNMPNVGQSLNIAALITSGAAVAKLLSP